MKYLLILSCLLLTFVGCSKTVDTYDLEERGGLYYEKFSDVPFTGKVDGEDQGKISKGKREGKWVFYFESGQLKKKGNYKDGKLDGEWLEYGNSGRLETKQNYKEGKEEGEQLYYKRNGQVANSEIYIEGVLCLTDGSKPLFMDLSSDTMSVQDNPICNNLWNTTLKD